MGMDLLVVHIHQMGLVMDKLLYTSVFLILVFALNITFVSAADFQEPMGDNTYYNVSYKMASNNATPFSVWIFIAAAGFYLLLFSFLASPEQNNDIFAYLSVPILGLATWQSLSLDVITGSGVTSQSGNFVMMEQHTIYAIPGITIIFVICFIISLLNIYRVNILNKDPNEIVYEDSKY